MPRRGNFFYFTFFTLLFIRIATSVTVTSMKKEKAAAQMFVSYCVSLINLFFVYQEIMGIIFKILLALLSFVRLNNLLHSCLLN